MKRFLWPGLLGIFFLVTMPALAGEEASFSGSFVWERPDGERLEGELDVVFTPGDEGEWRVAFDFDWEGKPRIFEGTASGSLGGDLIGNVASDDPSHPLKFEFKGAFSDGTFTGTHGYFNRDGELVDSGTLELALAG